MGLLKTPTWFEDATPVSPPSQWQYTAHSVVVTAASPAAGIFTGDLAFPLGTPIVLSAAVMPGGFTAGTTYYTVPTTSLNLLAFGLSATVGGTPIVATSAGTTVVARDSRYIFNYANIANFNKVALLVHADGTNGATSAPDSSTYAHAQTHVNAGPDLSTAVKQFGSASLRCGSGIGLSNGVIKYAAAGTEFNLTGALTIEGSFYIPASQVAAATPMICMKTAANATVMTISSSQNGGGNNSKLAFGLVSNNLGTAQATGATLLPTDTWHQYALVMTAAGVCTLYVNGAVHATASFGGVPVFSAVDRFELGGDNAASTYYQGYIDEVRFTNTLALYSAPYTPAVTAFLDPANAPLSALGNITYIAPALASGGLRGGLFGTLQFNYHIVQQASDSITFRYNIGAGNVDTVLTNTTGATGTVSICLDGATQLVFGFSATGGTNAIVALSEGSYDTTYGNISYNCTCTDLEGLDTLSNLRTRMMRQLGFSAMVNNPPPGMPELLNELLASAQRFLYRKFSQLRTRRFFSWNMAPGSRFYDFNANTDNTTGLHLDRYKDIEYVGVVLTNGAWIPLYEGIPPTVYTMISKWGIPARFERRQCIEVFPAPNDYYQLVVKGHFGLQAFAVDGDYTTIDAEAVFLYALAIAKAQYQKSDAATTAQLAKEYIGQLVAGAHGKQRYVPGTVPTVPAVQPVFLPLVNP